MKFTIHNGILERVELEGKERDAIIPDGVAAIGAGAFSGCEKLKSITIPNSVMEIKKTAFSGCNSLRTAIIPYGFQASKVFQETAFRSLQIHVTGMDEIGDSGYVYEYGIGFRGKKKDISKLLEAMLERATNQDIGSRMYCYEIFEGASVQIGSGQKLTWNFEKLAEDSVAQFVSGGYFRSEAVWDVYAAGSFEAVYDRHFKELLSLVPALEGCVWIQETCYNESVENPYHIYYYTETDSDDVVCQSIQVKTLKGDENAVLDEGDIDEDIEEDFWTDEWDALADQYALVPVQKEVIDAQFFAQLGRGKSYFHKLLDTEGGCALLPSYTAALKDTHLDGRPERIEQISIGDTLYLCNAVGERDAGVGVGAPCIAVCNEEGALGVLNTRISEALLEQVGGIDLEEAADTCGDEEVNRNLQALTTVTATMVKPLSKMRKGAKIPKLEVEITLDERLFAGRLDSQSPVLDSWQRRLREKRANGL